MKEKQSLIYRNVEEALTELNAADRGRYFICTCPECQEQEAFIYKNNINFIQCNRESECGERLLLRYEDKDTDLPFLKEQERNGLTRAQATQLKKYSDVMKLYLYNMESKALDSGYRGLSRETTTPFIADFIHEQGVQRMFEFGKELFPKDYSKSKWMCQRNIVMPIFGEDGLVDRVLLRSSIDTQLEPKEIQLIVNPSKDARDFFVDIPLNAKTIVIGEALLDTLSFRELDEKVGVMALTGAAKTKGLCDYLKSNQELWKDKNFVIATDSDAAGQKAASAIEQALEELGASTVRFPFPKGIEDANAFLTENRAGFTKVYSNMLYEFSKGRVIDKRKAYQYEP
ncbi:MAG: toprim domain-containing protein [Lysinibacillus sp.]